MYNVYRVKDGILAQNRALKATIKQLQKENSLLKAKASGEEGFRKSTMRIRHHINKMVAIFEEKKEDKKNKNEPKIWEKI